MKLYIRDSLERANWADFVVLDADPLENISNVRQVASVWIARNKAVR